MTFEYGRFLRISCVIVVAFGIYSLADKPGRSRGKRTMGQVKESGKPGVVPNAVAFGSGEVSIKQIVRAGVWLNLVSLVLIVAVLYTLIPWVFGIRT